MNEKKFKEIQDNYKPSIEEKRKEVWIQSNTSPAKTLEEIEDKCEGITCDRCETTVPLDELVYNVFDGVMHDKCGYIVYNLG